MNFLCFGDKNNKSILFIHGMASTAMLCYEPILKHLSNHYVILAEVNGHSESSYEMRYEDENIWLTQKMMSTLYDVSVAAVFQHIKRIYEDAELTPEAAIKKYLTVQVEGTRQVSRNLNHYNLQMIISVGFKKKGQDGYVY